MSEPLAIVGISCIFPKADDLQSYWCNIQSGVDAITPIPISHWNVADYFDADPKKPDMTYAKRGGFLSPVAFNPMDYGIAPKDVEATDTTQLLGLVAAKQALIDAGYATKPFNKERTSVILGVTGALELVIPLGARLGHPLWRRALKEAGVADDVAEDVVQRISDGYVGWQENSFPGLLGNVAAGRIANRLDLGGTNCVVDAACASSMAALHLGAMELAAGRADLVITGGIDTFNDIFMHMCFSKTPALSPSGDAKPFDKNCDGTILGEGLGMLVLKRLSDAQRDGDRIHAVIKGLASSSDGSGNAIYAPRSEGQVKALRRAYAAAGVTPDTVDLMEAHGTGTKVGDTTELHSMVEVYREARPEGTWTALGSVKSQIGHAKAAAGVAGIIKAALALENKVLPPTIKVTQPMDEIANSPFYVNTVKQPWLPRDNHPRRAAVSAFGFGGTNFHCVLEEFGSVKTKPGWTGEVEILALCADKPEALRATLNGIPVDLPWAELRARCRKSRQEFRRDAAHRLLIPISKGTALGPIRDSALLMLDKHSGKATWTLPTGVAYGSGKCRGKLGALFPGQGSQYVGMFRDLACQFPVMLEALEAANRIFATESPKSAKGKRLSDFIYPQPGFSDDVLADQEEELKSTDIAQPALGAAGLGAMNVMAWFGIKPEAAAGHSYGELLALCGAGRFETESLHRLSNVRGRLMAGGSKKGDRGAMLAAQTSEEVVTRFLSEEPCDLVIANRNSPSQFVLAGPKNQIEQAAIKLNQRSVRAKVLKVSAAFHSTLVADAREPFAAVLEKIPFRNGHIPVYANSTAKAYPASEKQARELLASQIVKPVDFMAQIQTMFDDGVTTFVEMGPGHVLTDLVQAILAGRDAETVAMDSSRGSRSGVFDLAAALCRVASLGHPVDLARWEESVETKTASSSGKLNLTIALTGANHRNATRKKESRKPKAPVASVPASIPAPVFVPTPAPVAAKLPSAPAQNFNSMPMNSTSLQGILALQKLQEETARLHRQFLENQDAARRTLENLLLQHRGAAQPPVPVAHTDPAPDKSTNPGTDKKTNDVTPVLLNVVAEKTGYPVEMLNLDMGLDSDLGIDSIKRVEIMSALRSQLPDAPEIKPDQLGTLQTLRQIAEFLGAGKSVSAVSPDPGTDKSMDVTGVLLSVVAEKTGYPVEMLSLDMGLDSDLGIDSIKRVEIMSALRGQLPDAPEIKPDQLGTLQTLRQIAEFLGSQKVVASPVSPAAPSCPIAAPLQRQLVKPVPLSEARPAISLPKKSRIWITEDGTPLAAELESQLAEQGFAVTRRTIVELLNSKSAPAGLVVLWPANGEAAALKDAFRLIQKAGPGLRKAHGILATVSRLNGRFGFGSLTDQAQLLSGGLAGLTKTARHEWPEVHCKAIDVAPESAPAALLAKELFLDGPVETGISGDARFELHIETVPFTDAKSQPVLSEGDVVIVTGGARGVTAAVAEQLARQCKPHLILLGRSQWIETEPEWLAGLQKESEIKKALLEHATNGDRTLKAVESAYRETMARREIHETLRQIRAAGAQVEYRSADVRNADEMKSVIGEIRRQHGPIRGVIHGAGVLADRKIEDKTPEQFDLVYNTKVQGLRNLLDAADNDDLKLIALFSSYTARFGRVGQCDYAAANEVMNKMAQGESRHRPNCRVVAFNWGPWNGGMVNDGLRRIFEKEGVGLIDLHAGAEFFAREALSASKENVEILVLASTQHGNGNGHTEDTAGFTVAFEREVSIKSMPCLVSHVLNGHPVVPAALMIEWLAHGAVHSNPGMMFHGMENFKVLKGVILDSSKPVTTAVLAGAPEVREGFLRVPVQLASRSGGKQILHARADILLTESLPAAPALAAVPVSGPGVAFDYHDGRLFHGSHFHAIEFIESNTPSLIVARVKTSPSPKQWVENPLRPTWLSDPLALDSSFQMMILWTLEHRQAASLPCAMRQYRQFATAFPKDGVRVVIRVTTANSALITSDLRFEDAQGKLIALAEGYECVVDNNLKEAFRQK